MITFKRQTFPFQICAQLARVQAVLAAYQDVSCHLGSEK